MDNNILAIFIQEGSRLASEAIRNRALKARPTTEDSMEKFLLESDERMNRLFSSEPVETISLTPAPVTTIKIDEPKVAPKKATAIATGCVPCAMGHFGTCSGILNESVRFAHGPDGVASPEVIDRIDMCMDELNAMERVDLRPEMTTQLKGWEKELAEKALTESRATRHLLEGLHDVDGLEKAAANIQTTRKEIGREWFQKKLNTLSPDDKLEISKRVMAKIDEMANTEAEQV